MLNQGERSVRQEPANRSRPLGRALVVEDDALIAMEIAEALADAGAAPVIICATIAAAMGELERGVPALLVLDVHLADRDDGWALAELAHQLGDAPPLVLFTTATPEMIPPSAATLGHMLPKPFRTEDLVSLVRRQTSSGLLARIRNVFSGS